MEKFTINIPNTKPPKDYRRGFSIYESLNDFMHGSCADFNVFLSDKYFKTTIRPAYRGNILVSPIELNIKNEYVLRQIVILDSGYLSEPELYIYRVEEDIKQLVFKLQVTTIPYSDLLPLYFRNKLTEPELISCLFDVNLPLQQFKGYCIAKEWDLENLEIIDVEAYNKLNKP